MISKAKIVLYAVFRKNRTPTESNIRLNFFRKLLLLQVRRISTYSELTDISHFDWQEAKKRAFKQYKVALFIICGYLIIDLRVYLHRHRLEKAEKALEEREAKGLGKFKRFDLFGDNPYWDKDLIDNYTFDPDNLEPANREYGI